MCVYGVSQHTIIPLLDCVCSHAWGIYPPPPHTHTHTHTNTSGEIFVCRSLGPISRFPIYQTVAVWALYGINVNLVCIVKYDVVQETAFTLHDYIFASSNLIHRIKNSRNTSFWAHFTDVLRTQHIFNGKEDRTWDFWQEFKDDRMHSCRMYMYYIFINIKQLHFSSKIITRGPGTLMLCFIIC